MPRRDREPSDRDKDRETENKSLSAAAAAGIGIEQMYQIYEKLNSAEDKTKVLVKL